VTSEVPPIGSPRHRQSGVVMMEFLIALFPVLIAFLGMAQFSFAAVTKLLVRHSAVVGARAAVVVLEESVDVRGTPPNLYGESPAGDLQLDDSGEPDLDGLRNAAGGVDAAGSLQEQIQSLMELADRGQSRIAQIRTAAYFPLLAISPDALDDGIGFLVGDGASGSERRSLRGAIGNTGISRIVGAFLYNLGAVAVTFPAAPGGDELRDEPYAHGDEVTVRVTYLMRCNVPIASLLLCDSGLALWAGSAWLDPALYWQFSRLGISRPQRQADVPDYVARAESALERLDRRQARIDAFDEHQDALDHAESPLVQLLLLLRPGARYMVIGAEATLPVQSARYYRRADGSGDGGAS
jgi:hypothetical protein